MRLFMIASFLVLAMFFFSVANAQEAMEVQPTWGVGIDAGVQRPYGDILQTGIGLVGGVNFRYLVSERFNMNLGVGYGELNDGFAKRNFYTNVINADLKANINVFRVGPLRPFVSFGIGYINYAYHLDPNEYNPATDIKFDPTQENDPFSATSYILGGGIEFFTSPRFSLTAIADYRHTSGDALDGSLQGDSNDGYLNSRIGLTYFFGQKKKPKTLTDEELAALRQFEEEDLTQLEDDVREEPTEKAQEPTQDEQFRQLQQRLESLSEMIDERDQDISQLRSEIQDREEKIAALEREIEEISQTPMPAPVSSTGDFKADYERALRHFYNREYDRAIALFSQLKQNYPNHKLTSNCQYWIGESYFGKGQYTQAIDAFTAVLSYDFSYKFDDALIMLGNSYRRLGDVENARRYYQQLLNQYPDSEYAGFARSALANL